MTGSQRTPRFRLAAVVLDGRDAIALAQFYAQLLGWHMAVMEDGDWVELSDPQGSSIIAFQRNPEHMQPTWPDEAGAQQQQAHLDFAVKDVQQLQEAVQHALRCGASLPSAQYGQDDGIDCPFVTLIDPQGHPFCIVAQ